MIHRTVLIALALVFSAVHISAQQPRLKSSPSPSPSPSLIQSDDESIRVFTEEVRLPVVALDAYGHYDPTLEPEDVLVLEDGVIQQVKSLRHIPANVLFLLDTGGELSGLGGMSKSTSLTKEVAANLIGRLAEGSWISVVQSGSSAEVIQPWTRDKAAALKVIRTKLYSSKRSRISDAI